MKPTINDQIAMYCNLLNEWYVAYEPMRNPIGRYSITATRYFDNNL